MQRKQKKSFTTLSLLKKKALESACSSHVSKLPSILESASESQKLYALRRIAGYIRLMGQFSGEKEK